MRHIDSIVLFFNEMKRKSDEIIAKLSEELQELVLKDGSKLTIDAEGAVTKDGEAVEDGDYELESGEIAIVEGGKYMGTKTVEEEKQEEEPTAEEEPKKEMETVEIDDVKYEVEKAVYDYVESLKATIEELKADVEKAKAESAKPAEAKVEQSRQNFSWLNGLK